MVTTKRRVPAAATKVTSVAKLEWVPIPQMRVSEMAQRKHNPRRVDKLIAEMDLERLGHPTVSFRDGFYYIIDGQHRVKALIGWGEGDSWIECWVYYDLTQAEEASLFISLNDALPVTSFDKFRISIEAGDPRSVDIANIVAELDLKITRQVTAGGIRATDTLERIYERSGREVLRRVLNINGAAFGGYELGALMLDATGLVVGRYPKLADEHLTKKLVMFRGGPQLLLGRADTLRQRTGQRKTQCLASELVDLYNSGTKLPPGGRLTKWWKTPEPETGHQEAESA